VSFALLAERERPLTLVQLERTLADLERAGVVSSDYDETCGERVAPGDTAPPRGRGERHLTTRRRPATAPMPNGAATAPIPNDANDAAESCGITAMSFERRAVHARDRDPLSHFAVLRRHQLRRPGHFSSFPSRGTARQRVPHHVTPPTRAECRAQTLERFGRWCRQRRCIVGG
jgi:hypothetical protein